MHSLLRQVRPATGLFLHQEQRRWIGFIKVSFMGGGAGGEVHWKHNTDLFANVMF